MDGTGYIELSANEHFEWSDEGPEGFEVTETDNGAQS
jgi:hypothetical protein